MKQIYKSISIMSILACACFPVLIMCSIWIDVQDQEVLRKLFWTDIVAILTFLGAGAVMELSVKNISK